MPEKAPEIHRETLAERKERIEAKTREALAKLKIIVEQRREALKDKDVTDKEKEAIKRSARKIRDFIYGATITEAMNDDEESRNMRERALLDALDIVLEEEKGLGRNEMLSLIFGEKAVDKTKKVFSSLTEDEKPITPKKIKDLPNVIVDSFLEQRLEECFEYFDVIGDRDIQGRLLKIAAEKRPEYLLIYLNKPSILGHPIAKDAFIQAGKSMPKPILASFSHFSKMPYAKAVLSSVIDHYPGSLIKYREDFLKKTEAEGNQREAPFVNEKYFDELLEKDAIASSEIYPETSKWYLEKIVKTKSDKKNENIEKCKNLLEIHNALVKIEGFFKRMEYLNKMLDFYHESFSKELAEINKEKNLSLEPAGIKKEPFEFVLINTWKNPKDKNKYPIRVGLSIEDLKNKDIRSVISEKLNNEDKIMKTQRTEWKRSFDFDLPKKGETEFFSIAVPDKTKGMESDFMRLVDIYQVYGAEGSVMMQNTDEWLNEKKNIKDPTKIETVYEPPTPKNILEKLGSALDRAIEAGKKQFIFDYLMHGSERGGAGALWKRSPDGKRWLISEMDPIYFAREIAKKDRASKIDILIVAESCFGGKQIERILDYLIAKKVKIKDLRVVSAASYDTGASFGQTAESASVVSDAMRGDNAAVKNYYLVQYFEMIKDMEKHGKRIKSPVGTFGHALSYADRMAKEDTMDIVGKEQDMVAISVKQ